jgi:RimK family alpha-L-glutamate ligase
MKKILFIGIGKAEAPGQRMIKALLKNKITYVYVRWSDLAFFGNKVYAQVKELNFDEIGAVFFDIPRFSVTTKFFDGRRKETDFHLENELQVLLTILKEKNIDALNRDFFLKHPYYNKFSQTYIFESNGVASIPTVHLSDNKEKKILEIFAKTGFVFPLVAKESYGARGSKVWKIFNQPELKAFIEGRRNLNVVFQPFVENEADYRVIVVGGKCLGVMKRTAKDGEWKNNFSLGGDVAKHEDEKMKEFAIQACQKMNLDIAGLDIFSTPTGYLVIEANLFFGLDGFESVFEKLDVSEEIVKLLVSKMQE